ncbi:CBS domain-containing protein [Tropicimonas sp. TH_r6]|uniref:CBS domain-containing protein n=1 Tax=Tropicimonas sp. TH_r6 TaxID=3082085 RepID=UPI0029549B89|nr:CBS domain-containing protein [Tropicimonas sp. TH_r6]MDV7141980.1 CBS domain-containing protein [Tropicimonas sp. TH_r6]
MVSKKKTPHFGHENPHTHSQSVEASVANASKGTAENILADKGHEVVSVRPADTIRHVVRVMYDHQIGSVVVKDQNGHLVGMLTERDLVMGFATHPDEDPDNTCAEQLMTREVVTVTSETPVLEILHTMSEGRFRHVPVLDGEHIAGLISIGDVVKFRLRELEYEALKLKQMIVG